MLHDPISRLTEDELDTMLEDALRREDFDTLWLVIQELERRGEVIQV